MKRATFNKPFNGKENALKLIPESYKIDGNKFEVTDGNETYVIKWEGSITEGMGSILLEADKSLISEDMQRIKHLMGYSSKETLGNLKGSERLDENKSFTKNLGKSKTLINEAFGMGFTSENNFDGNEMEVKEIEVRKDMVTNLKNETDDANAVEATNKADAKNSAADGVEVIDESDDVKNFQDILSSNPKITMAMKKINTRDEKIELGVSLLEALAGGDSALLSKIARAALSKSNQKADATNNDTADIARDPNAADGPIGMNEGDVEECDTNDSLEETDRFDEIFEGMYELDEEVETRPCTCGPHSQPSNGSGVVPVGFCENCGRKV